MRENRNESFVRVFYTEHPQLKGIYCAERSIIPPPTYAPTIIRVEQSFSRNYKMLGVPLVIVNPDTNYVITGLFPCPSIQNTYQGDFVTNDYSPVIFKFSDCKSYITAYCFKNSNMSKQLINQVANDLA